MSCTIPITVEVSNEVFRLLSNALMLADQHAVAYAAGHGRDTSEPLYAAFRRLEWTIRDEAEKRAKEAKP
jgi:hypothetical protein